MAIENIGLYPITIDVYKKHKETTVQANDNDSNGRGLLITLVKDGVPFNSTGISLKIGFRNAVGEERLYDCDIVDALTGKYKVFYPTEMLSGNGGRVVKLEVKAYEGTGALLNYSPLFVYVNTSEVSDDAIAGTNEASTLRNLYDGVSDLLRANMLVASDELATAPIPRVADKIGNITERDIIDMSQILPYNIRAEIEDNQDISDYLIQKMQVKKSLFLPPGTYVISKEILFPDGITIKGSGNETVLHFLNGGKLRLGYQCIVTDLKITAAENFTGDIIFLNSYFVNESIKQKCGIVIRNIYAEKIYNSDESIFLHLRGMASGNVPSIPGFWGALFENITIHGFTIPTKISLMDGWIHTNDFINWRVETFKNAIVLDGQKSAPERDDSRIRRNKFVNWTIQPNPDTTEQVFVQNKDFPNYFANIDVWDLTRWPDGRYIDLGNIPITDYNDDRNNLVNRRHGTNYLTERYYPILRKVDLGSTLYATLTYSEGASSYCEIDIVNDVITVRESADFSRKFSFFKDVRGIIYLRVSSDAFGALYYKSLRNASTTFYYNYSDLNANRPAMTPLTVNYKYIVEGVQTIIDNAYIQGGATGSGAWFQATNVITLSARFDTTNHNSATAAFQLPAPLAGEIGSIDSINYRISASGFVYLKAGISRLEINTTYIRSR